MLKHLLLIVIAFMSAAPSFAMAKEGCGGTCTACHSLSVKEAGDLLKPTGVTVKSVRMAPANGLFEVMVEKDSRSGVLFIDYGKKHFLQGMMVSLPDLKPVAAHQSELQQQQPKAATKVDISTIPVEHAVILGNPKATKKLYVFTDPDCPYCRKGHEQLKKLAEIAPDVAIHVMLFPLPMHPAAYDKSRAVIETKSLELLDKAFEGKEVPKPASDAGKAAVDAIIKFANANGINGTPTMVLPDGTVQVGMADAETMKKMVERDLTP